MEIQVSEKEYCKLVVDYQADAEQIDNKKLEVLSAFKKAPVPGFRQGKANIEVIKIHYKKQIDEALKQALAEEAFHNTLFEKNIKPLGQPDFTSISLNGDRFACSFSFNKRPTFELGEYKGFEVPKPPAEFTADELTERMLEELRIQNGTMVPYGDSDFVELGDKIIIAYEGFIDGERMEAVSSQGELLDVGANPLKEFDNNLLGMSIGEVRNFDILVPDTGLSSLRGKTVNFSVNITSGSKIEKVPLDDSLALKLKQSSFADLRQYVATAASQKLEEVNRMGINQQISARLVAAHDFKVPDWLSLSEAKYLAINSKKEWELLSDADRESFINLASDNVKLALILDKIREVEPDAQLADQEVIKIIKENIEKSNRDQNEVLAEMNKTGYLPVLVARLRDEYTLDFILKHTTIVE